MVVLQLIKSACQRPSEAHTAQPNYSLVVKTCQVKISSNGAAVTMSSCSVRFCSACSRQPRKG
eukprot:1366016-Amphidinium_carterae.1